MSFEACVLIFISLTTLFYELLIFQMYSHFIIILYFYLTGKFYQHGNQVHYRDYD